MTFWTAGAAAGGAVAVAVLAEARGISVGVGGVGVEDAFEEGFQGGEAAGDDADVGLDAVLVSNVMWT